MKITFLGTSHGDPTKNRFNTSLLLETAGAGYLFDCGSPATTTLIRRGFDFKKLRGVFISHMHLDHSGDLLNVLKHLVKHNQDAHAYLPDPAAMPLVDSFLRLAYPIPSGVKTDYHLIQPGRFYADENISITAIPNNHGHGKFPSYSFLIESADRKILYTGDLAADLEDFPSEAAEKADLCICELTHSPREIMEKKMQSLRLKQIIFTHIGPRYEKDDVLNLPKVPFPASAASDGDVFSIE